MIYFSPFIHTCFIYIFVYNTIFCVYLFDEFFLINMSYISLLGWHCGLSSCLLWMWGLVLALNEAWLSLIYVFYVAAMFFSQTRFSLFHFFLIENDAWLSSVVQSVAIPSLINEVRILYMCWPTPLFIKIRLGNEPLVFGSHN